MTSFSRLAGKPLVAGELHGEGALALGHAPQVGRVAEGLGQRDFAFDPGRGPVDLRRQRSCRARLVRSPTTEPWNGLGHSISIRITGSRSTGRVREKFSRIVVWAQIWKARSELSTSW